MKTSWLVLVALAACNCHEDRGVPVTPRPTTSAKALTIEDSQRTLYAGAPTTTFSATTSSEHEAIAALVPALLEATAAPTPPTSPATWQDTAAAAGFRIEAWTIAGEPYWALVEAAGKARGAGAYIFRVAPRDPRAPVILLQAPHELFDLGTGRLAAELMFTARSGARPRALFTNTMHRYQLAPGDKKKRRHNPADVAHNADHAFTVATDAFAIAAGDATRVIQLHGFGARLDDDDDDDGGDGADTAAIAMVVSAGDPRGSSPLSGAIAAAAARAFGAGVKRYPEDTRVLGATTNAQKRVLEKSRAAFVHVEMSSELRAQLAASADLRARLAAVLFDTEPGR